MTKFSFLATALAAGVLASASAQANIVADPSFEQGTAGASPWAQSSTNYGSPLCTISNCGTGTGTGPRTGEWWAWLGGAAALETGSVSQNITLLGGASSLSFWFENVVSGSPLDFIEVRVNGSTAWRYEAGGAFSGILGYRQINVDLTPFGAGPRVLEFYSVSGNAGLVSNFFVDDVSVVTAPIPEPGTYGLMALGLAGLLVARRQAARR